MKNLNNLRQQRVTYLEPNCSIHTTMSHVLWQKQNGKNFLNQLHPPSSMNSFDYAQSVSYPSNLQEPGPAYFKSARKCGMFGVACEPCSCQVNIVIDEDDGPGKGANVSVSMLDHFLSNHGFQVKSTLSNLGSSFVSLKMHLCTLRLCIINTQNLF